MNGRAWTEEERAFLVRTHAQLSVSEQAHALQRTPESVRAARMRLLAQGRIHVHQRTNNRPWSSQDLNKLQDLIEEGKPTISIVRSLKRSRQAIHEACERHGIRIFALRDSLVLTANQVAKLLDVETSTVIDWIRAGIIQAHRRSKKKRGSPHLITHTSLQAFMADRHTWPAWETAQVVDPIWREEAERCRAVAGGRWVSIKELVGRLYAVDSQIVRWIQSGRWQVETMRYGNRWYVWESDDRPLERPAMRPVRGRKRFAAD